MFFNLIKGFKQAKEFFAEPPNFNHHFTLKTPVQHEECTHTIESLSTLDRLLTIKRIGKEDPVLRFLVDMSGTAWFARETRPDVKAPKHFQMTGESQGNTCCSTAGNIKFTNTSCRVLKNLNHRSGDFHPSFHSLRLFLAILILNEDILPFKLPRIITIKELDSQGKLLRKHRWSLLRLKNWVESFRHDEELMKKLMNQKVESKIVYYEATMLEAV